MQPPLYVRPLTDAEHDTLKAGLRSSDAFTLRRSQILLASARHESPPTIARQLGCASQTVRNTIHAFNDRGLAALLERSIATTPSRPPSMRRDWSTSRPSPIAAPATSAIPPAFGPSTSWPRRARRRD